MRVSIFSRRFAFSLYLFQNSIKLFSSCSSSTKFVTDTLSRNMMGSYQPLQVGLTGSIGMGKSAVARQFRELGFPVFDADEAVHSLYAQGGAAVAAIEQSFPEAIVDGSVHRPTLARRVLGNPTDLTTLESIVHPLVAAERKQFFEKACIARDFLCVYDVPLLLENRKNHDVHCVVVATASAETQRERVLSRPGMTPEKFESILCKQMPDEEKRKQADFLVCTDYPAFSEARAQIANLITELVKRNPAHLDQWKREHSSGAETRRIEYVIFDLDDTLVPVMNPLRAGLSALIDFMDVKMPLSKGSVMEGQMSKLMKRLSEDEVLIAHDLTELRRRALRALACPHGEEGHVDEALEVFLRARSDVAAHLYTDVLPCMDWLRAEGIPMAVLTNGNAQLMDAPVIKDYLSFSICANEVGAMKPAPAGFFAAAKKASVPLDRILFVGDSFSKDVEGARSVGMLTALLTRRFPKVQAVEAHSSADLDVMDFGGRASQGQNPIENQAGDPVGGTGGAAGASADIHMQTLFPTDQVGAGAGAGGAAGASADIQLQTLFPSELGEKMRAFFGR